MLMGHQIEERAICPHVANSLETSAALVSNIKLDIAKGLHVVVVTKI